MGHRKQDQQWELRLREYAEHYDHVFASGKTVRRANQRLEWHLYLGSHFICEGTADDEAHAIEQTSGVVRAYIDDKVERTHGKHRTIVLDHEQIMADASQS